MHIIGTHVLIPVNLGPASGSDLPLTAQITNDL